MNPAQQFNAYIVAEFRANQGKVTGGGFAGAPLLLLHTRGARTDQEYVNPMMYARDGDRYLVFASYRGADHNPGWYHNLIAHPDVEIEIGGRTLSVHAEVLKGDERDEKFARQAAEYPIFAAYQSQTTRIIPVIALTPR